MTKLVWKKEQYHIFGGVEKGSLYDSSTAVAWPGLVSVDVDKTISVESFWYLGKKTNTYISQSDPVIKVASLGIPKAFVGHFSRSLSSDGVVLEASAMKSFDFSYQTPVFDSTGIKIGYEIHIWANVVGVLDPQTDASISDSVNTSLRSLSLYPAPRDTRGNNFSPTSHVIIDSSEANARTVSNIEASLYGTDQANGSTKFVFDTSIFGGLFADEAYAPYTSDDDRIRVYSSAVGEWTAVDGTYSNETNVTVNASGEYTITNATVLYDDGDTVIFRETEF